MASLDHAQTRFRRNADYAASIFGHRDCHGICFTNLIGCESIRIARVRLSDLIENNYKVTEAGLEI